MLNLMDCDWYINKFFLIQKTKQNSILKNIVKWWGFQVFCKLMFSLDWESKVKILHTILFIISKETINISILMDNYLSKQVPSLVTPLEEQFLDHFQAIVICNWDNIVPLCFDSRSPKMNIDGQKWIRQNILKRHILKCSSKDRKARSLGR